MSTPIETSGAFDAVPNLLSLHPPPEPWATVQNALLRFFRIRVDALQVEGRQDRLNTFAEVLSAKALLQRVAIWEAIPFTTDEERMAGLEGLKAYALGIAYLALCDSLDEQRAAQPRCIVNLGAVEEIDDLGSRKNLSLDEDAMIARIDSGRGVVKLIEDADREFFWEDVHAWCAARVRNRFGTWTPPGSELTPMALTELRVHGQALAPDEATWLRILSIRSCPEDLVVDSETTPKDVFERFYEAVKKAFWRVALKNRLACPPKKVRTGDLLIRGGGFSYGQ